MQRMWRKMFAAVAGVLVVAGLASAQNSIPQQLPIAPPALMPAKAQPALLAAPASAPVAGSPVIPAGAIHVRGSGGCSSCGTPAPAANGCGGCGSAGGNGCPSAKFTCGFMFGSCKSFFNPCGPGGIGGGHGLGGRCGRLPYGTPYGTGFNTCNYDSYLNH